MNTRHFIIFAIILIFICTLGSAYAFKEEPKPIEIHTPQRKIERQFSIPDLTSFNQSKDDFKMNRDCPRFSENSPKNKV